MRKIRMSSDGSMTFVPSKSKLSALETETSFDDDKVVEQQENSSAETRPQCISIDADNTKTRRQRNCDSFARIHLCSGRIQLQFRS